MKKQRRKKDVQEPAFGISAPGAWWIPAGVFALTLACFLPALKAGLVWDDAASIAINPNIRNFGWRELRWMFSTFYLGPYQPLTWLSFAVDYAAWGLKPLGYHLTNILLHSANAVLFYKIGLELLPRAGITLKSTPVYAAWAALAFSIHPLRVESVAWITERRDVLSGFFYLGSILLYIRGRIRWSLAAFVLGLGSKAIALGFPLALTVLDAYPLDRLPQQLKDWLKPQYRSVWREKILFWLVSIAAAAAAYRGQLSAKAFELHALEIGILERFSQAAYGLVFYLRKTLFPWDLLPLYERPAVIDPFSGPFLAGTLSIIVISVVLIVQRKRWPAAAAGAICYAALLAPVLGLVPFGRQMTADRYSYLTCLPWPLLAAGFLNQAKSRWAAAALLAALGALTWRQTGHWKDEASLWSHALSVEPRSSLFHGKLGTVLLAKGLTSEGIGHIDEALKLDPGNESAHYNLGVYHSGQGRFPEALDHFRKAAEIRPGFLAARTNIALLLSKTGRKEEAAAHYREIIRFNPNYGPVRGMLGELLVAEGHKEEAVQQFREALRIFPGDAVARQNLGILLMDSSNR